MLFKIEHLKVCYGRQTALDIDTPVTFMEGERIGVIGSNGAGKTTLIKSLLGLTDYKGHIETELKPEDMAVHMQHNSYTTAMNVRYIMEAILNTKIKENSRLKELIAYFDFENCLNKKYKALSGGQKQRFTIIMVMFQDAPLTFFDEVTSGLDFETRQRMMEKLTAWYQDKKTALCIVSHYYEELEQLADKILILDKGRVISFGDKNELFLTYCGKSIIIVENKEENRILVKEFPKLKSSGHLIALSCRDEEIEQKITDKLIRNNVNFKRSNCDIETMFINAKASFYEKRGEHEYEGA